MNNTVSPVYRFPDEGLDRLTLSLNQIPGHGIVMRLLFGLGTRALSKITTWSPGYAYSLCDCVCIRSLLSALKRLCPYIKIGVGLWMCSHRDFDFIFI